MAHRGGGRRGGDKAPAGKLVLSPAEQWELGSPNADSNNELTAEQKDQQLIDVLRSLGVPESELKPLYSVPTFRQGQAEDVNPLNVRVCGRYTIMGRRRRDYIWLLIEDMNGKNTKRERKAIRRELDTFEEEVAALFKQITDAGGIPVEMPDHFDEYPVYEPKPKRK